MEQKEWVLQRCSVQLVDAGRASDSELETEEVAEEPINYRFGDDVVLEHTQFLRENEIIFAAVALNDQYCVVYTALDELPKGKDPSINGEVYCVKIRTGQAKPLYNEKMQ